LQLYVGVVVVYNLMPLDLSLSPVEIYRKWAAGRLVLVPFGFTYANTTEMLYGRATDVAIWIPVALLLVVNHWPRQQAWLLTVGLAASVEFLQLFVYSRVSDVTQIVLAAGGAWIGVVIATRFDLGTRSRTTAPSAVHSGAAFVFRRLAFWGLLMVVWVVILAAIFWYPYAFNLHREFVIGRAKALLASVPFQAYYYGSEYRALTEVIHKTVFFVPCGVISAMLCVSVPSLRERSVLSLLVAFLLISGVAAFIDAGRFLMPTKGIDFADGFLQVAGGLLGFWGTTKARAMAQP